MITIHGVNPILIRLLANVLFRIRENSNPGPEILSAPKPMLRALLQDIGSVYQGKTCLMWETW